MELRGKIGRALVALVLAGALWVFTSAAAHAQCSPVGWSVGIAFGEDSVRYYFEGPAMAWTTIGVVDQKGATWTIDDRLYRESGVVVLQIRMKDGEVLRTPLFQVEGMCGFASEPNERDERIVFGNVMRWPHYHPDIKPAGHADGEVKRS